MGGICSSGCAGVLGASPQSTAATEPNLFDILPRDPNAPGTCVERSGCVCGVQIECARNSFARALLPRRSPRAALSWMLLSLLLLLLFR